MRALEKVTRFIRSTPSSLRIFLKLLYILRCAFYSRREPNYPENEIFIKTLMRLTVVEVAFFLGRRGLRKIGTNVNVRKIYAQVNFFYFFYSFLILRVIFSLF